MIKRSTSFFVFKVVFSAGLTGTAVSPTLADMPAQSARTTIDLRDGWRFKQDDSVIGADAPTFDDSSWSTVSVPHTWNKVGYYLTPRDADSNRPEQVDKTQGIGWYRLSFTPSAASAGKQAWLEFDAASRTAEVWLNGVRLGEHRGGFSRFRLDATQALKPGTTNLLVVKTDNSRPASGGSTADTLPLTGDFFVHGGLYRPVRLVFTDPVHIDMLDFGGPGVYAYTAAITGSAAQIAVVAKLRNDAREAARLTVVTRLVDRAGAVAAERSTQVELAAASASELPQSLTVNRARLWQGVADPYLYRLSVEVRTAEGRVLDATEQSFGIRQMRMDPANGFFLNGKPYRLHGVGFHQDHEGKGWAGSAADVEKDVALIREMGANTIRLTHYQHGQPIHDLADKYGLVLWDEIPLVSSWTLGKETNASPALLANARQQLTELIRQNGNHAAVANWGIANEVDFGNSLPVFLSNPGGPIPDPLPLLAELNALAKQEDPSRPTALATCCEGRLFASNVTVPVTAPSADLGGANRYFGWYYGKSEELDAHLESLRAARSGQPLAVTEYGAGGAITMHSDNPLGGPVDSRGRNQPEEYMSYVHERNWPILKAKPYLWATWIWVAFDFATTVRREGDADDVNTKGMITYDRKVKKDAFYYYKANWSDVPTVYVAGRRYVDRAYAVTDVRVYSNAPVTELAVNGRTIGKLANCPDRVCVWHNVRLAAGANDVTARGRFGSKVVADKISWKLAPEQLRSVRIDAGALMAASSKNGRFGSDNFFDGGEAGTVIKPADYGKPAVPAKIVNTVDADLIATYRRGKFAYSVPVANGRYDIHLSFVEPSASAGERMFDVTANGKVALRNFDIAGEAGGSMAMVVRTFEVDVVDGQLRLGFVPSKGDAIVSAIEVVAH